MNQEIKLTVTAQSAQIIVDALGERPHREVRALIDSIVLQTNQQLEAAEAAAAQQSTQGG